MTQEFKNKIEHLADVEREATDNMKILLKRKDVSVNVSASFIMSLWVGYREIAFCLSEDVESDKPFTYKIKEPRDTNIRFELINGNMEVNKNYNLDKINKNINMNIKHQEIIKYVLKNNLVTEMFKILEYALTKYQLLYAS